MFTVCLVLVSLWQVWGAHWLLYTKWYWQVVHGLVGPQVIGYCTQSVTVADVHVVGPQVTVHKVSLWQMWWAHRLLYTKCHCGRSTGTGLLYTKGREEVVNY